jgi:hypothetical protein
MSLCDGSSRLKLDGPQGRSYKQAEVPNAENESDNRDSQHLCGSRFG